MNVPEMTDAELSELEAAVRKEKARRAQMCRVCGGHIPLWHLHVCDGGSGANLHLDSKEARLLTQ